jgi:hypothetical protein
MQNKSIARTAGFAGMAGAVIWIIAVIMEAGLGLKTPDSGPLNNVNQLIYSMGMIGILIGILGLLWGDAVKGTFGRIAVILFALGYLILVSANLLTVSSGSEDQILYPIGGIVSLLGAVFTGIAVAVEKRWSGWQRFMPLIHAAFVFFVLYLPLFIANQEPTPLKELLWGVSLLLMGLAVYTSPNQLPADELAAAA